jgi:predicted dinucleotide-binding enzyme
MKKQELPPGWTEEQIREVIAHYDSQTEDEQADEIEAAAQAENLTLMAVPTELVPDILELIARKRGA